MELVIGIVSVIIAFCALGFTIWQGAQTKRHNKLSVMPHLTTWTHSDNSKNIYVIELLNNGIGPALIKSFQIQVDGHTINGEGTEPIIKTLKILFPGYQYSSRQSFLNRGYMMTAKESRPLVIVQFAATKIPSQDEVDHAIKRTRLMISYASIYGDEFQFDTNEMQSI